MVIGGDCLDKNPVAKERGPPSLTSWGELPCSHYYSAAVAPRRNGSWSYADSENHQGIIDSARRICVVLHEIVHVSCYMT